MGVPAQEMMGMEFRELWPEPIRPQIDAAVQKVLAGSQCAFDAYRLDGPEKTWWSVIIAPIIDDSGSVTKFISIATDSTYRKRAEEDRVAFYEQRILMEKRHAREKEQLLMDLHDGIGSIAVNMSMIAAMGQQAADEDGMRETLSSLSQLSHDAITEVRGFMTSLDPVELNWRSLAAELNHRGGTMLAPHHIAFSFNSAIGDAVQEPGSLFWVNLVKIYKEALTNSIKHSNADSVVVDLSVGRRELLLTIRDNGVGCADLDRPGRGLANIRKRTAALGGRVTMTGTGGMQIALAVPLPFTIPVPA